MISHCELGGALGGDEEFQGLHCDVRVGLKGLKGHGEGQGDTSGQSQLFDHLPSQGYATNVQNFRKGKATGNRVGVEG